MSLNDPLGRLERRRQAEYETLHQQLVKAGVDTPEAVSELTAQVNRRALTFVAVVLVGGMVLGLLFPNAAPVIAGCGVLALIWVVATLKNSRRHLQRYRDELH